MKISSGTVIEILMKLRSLFQYNTSRDKDNLEQPFRAEIYSLEALAQHGKVVAQKHKTSYGKTKESLLNRLDNNEGKLLQVRDLMVKSIRFGKQVTPAAEWMLDNFYLIEEQIILAKRHLPKGYSQGLPYLTEGTSVNLPRVYDIVLEVIAHSDGRVDALSLSNFIASYQQISQLTLGELWAVPIMLRLAIIENIRRIGSNIALDMIDHDLAEFWAEKMLVAIKDAPGALVLSLADMIRAKPILDSAFVAEFTRKLKGHGTSLSLSLNWIEDQLLSLGVSGAEMVALENKKLASNQISVKNSINTLRFIGSNDWKVFVENLSCVEVVLRKDASGIYPLMDFTTRDTYRHVVEKLAKTSTFSEPEVAEIVLNLARQQHEKTPKDRSAHIGYYLIDKGLQQAMKLAKSRLRFRDRFAGFSAKMPLSLYGICIVLLTLLFAGGMCYLTFHDGAHTMLLPFIAVFLSLAGAWQLAISMVNWAITILKKPRLLPKMDFSKKIPQQYRTLVVIPTMLNSKNYIEELLETLEIRYLSNSEAHIHYALLTDFKDAATEHLPEDAELVNYAKSGILALNEKYNRGKKELFFLFHRPRVWSKSEQKWMGYERKRGKLGALNSLLRGQHTKSFSVIVADIELLQKIKYVITLDSDTQMPREAARKMIAAMAHPLNHAVFNEKLKRVTDGYGILQPRIATAIPKSASSLYLQLEGNDVGIDPYTHVSSDVYQDLFSEGSFIGKGIYDVDMFEKAVSNAFQENRILSHDLLEGCYTRSGLLSDVLLYEESPTQYLSDVKRHHRWIRGDWQIAAWMMPYVTNAKKKLVANNLSALSRWKILDNLRRSLLPLALLLLLVFGWTVMPYAAFWTLFVTFIITLPVITSTLWQLIHKPEEINVHAHLSEVAIAIRNIIYRFLFGLAVLPFQAYKNSDAIIRTHWRMIISKRKLLEWTPSDIASSQVNNNLGSVYVSMWVAPVLSIGIGLFLSWMHPLNFLIAVPILILWFLAPALTWRLSLPLKEANSELSQDQIEFLHTVARKTWAYFETFVNENENWLPPDNYQEQPVAVIAQRTSPTNLGLNLLANLTAFDFGYISMKSMLYRTDQSLQAMDKLERYEGHFYNWYDTQTMKPLPPRYISTVDSGNLIGHILTLKQGLLLIKEKPCFDAQIFQGIASAAQIVTADLVSNNSELIKEWRSYEWLPAEVIESPSECAVFLLEISGRLIAFKEKMEISNLEIDWFNRLETQEQGLLADFENTIPWVHLLPIPEKYNELKMIDTFFSIHSLLNQEDLMLDIISGYLKEVTSDEDSKWLNELRKALMTGLSLAKSNEALINSMASLCEKFSDVNYDFLYEPSLSQFRIGFNVDDQRKDESYYDLLASEVRLAVFTAIAQGKVPQESWFSLGRLLTQSGGDPILLSWSGSMFEYLMPQLVMPTFDKTLLQQTNKAMVKRQIDYANQRAIPWGISESAYNAVDANMNYQYKAFGVPGLGMKRGLEDDMVIAPYASMMALMVMPQKACVNLELLSHIGFEGEYGFYEAIDYTPSRLPTGFEEVVIRSFMVHHQGMGFLSLSYLLLNKPMQTRFNNDPRFQGTLLLLQERIPRASVFNAHIPEAMQIQETASVSNVRNIFTTQTPLPEIQLLSNGNYHVMITNTGSGYSRWHNLALTRWREDAIMDNYGIFCYIKDVDNDIYWSNTIQPTLVQPDKYEVLFSPGHIQFQRQDKDIITKTEIVVSPEDDIELRKVRITNRSNQTKTIELTTYAEVILATQASDEAHQAFSNLFVQTEILEEQKAILCTRRPRSFEEKPPWMFHLMDVYGGIVFESVSYETDRRKFIGRGNTLAEPAAMKDEVLSGSDGAVLDPIMSVRYRFTIKAGHTAVIDIVHGVSDTKENCLSLMHKYRDHHIKKRPFEIFMTHSQAILRQIDASDADVELYDRLAGSILFANSNLRANLAIRNSNLRGQSGLWSHSISGDLPIVLLHIIDGENIVIVQQLMQAHAYWRLKGLAVDLVIWNENKGAYRQDLQQEIMGMIAHEQNNSDAAGKQGAVFLKQTDQLSPEDRILFESVARVIIYDNQGSLSEQIAKTFADKIMPPLLEVNTEAIIEDENDIVLPSTLQFNNELGGFSPDGKSYIILTTPNIVTPAPWINVLANPDFGTVISESGSSYTWLENAHECRITPWTNDAVLDAGAEAFYIRDEFSGKFWSPCPFPIKSSRNYLTTHGFGYSTFEHSENKISSLMTVFVHESKPIKFITIKLKNNSDKDRTLSVFGYAEIILGDVRSKTNMHVISETDASTGALLFRNRYNTAFNNSISYFTSNISTQGYTTDRLEFVGQNNTLATPKALYRKKLSNRIDTGRDSCAALQVMVELRSGEEAEVVFQLGGGNNFSEIIAQIHEFNSLNAVHNSLSDVKLYWQNLVAAQQLITPDDALNILSNGWLVYQTVASRIYARSGFYQSGGAFGFRDQLQDVLALLHAAPQLAREQICLSASRQFEEGDVQHWWHPPTGAGVRTKCSDDLLWLPFVVTHYVNVTGDMDILKEQISYLKGSHLSDGQESIYEVPQLSVVHENLFQHCVRSINRSLVFGKHGLPLIGTGDWNDGLDKVGEKGLGESVWLAFFLYDILNKFELIAQDFEDISFAEICRTNAEALKNNINEKAWDGAWYKRAWFDDGHELGSHNNDECKIDSISQSWAVLSGVATETRGTGAMAALDKYLVDRNIRIIKLLNPAFNDGNLNPGYIKGYVPGIRENGGQYSHAAVWTLMAFAKLGDRAKVYELFNLIQPINHSQNKLNASIYKVEPYVMAADVYANESHLGMGGWTWYTGSAGWLYQFIISSLVGLTKHGNSLTFNPCFPLEWPSVTVTYKFGATEYVIVVYQSSDIPSAFQTLNGKRSEGNSILMIDDGKTHNVEVHALI